MDEAGQRVTAGGHLVMVRVVVAYTVDVVNSAGFVEEVGTGAEVVSSTGFAEEVDSTGAEVPVGPGHQVVKLVIVAVTTWPFVQDVTVGAQEVTV